MVVTTQNFICVVVGAGDTGDGGRDSVRAIPISSNVALLVVSTIVREGPGSCSSVNRVLAWPLRSPGLDPQHRINRSDGASL